MIHSTVITTTTQQHQSMLARFEAPQGVDGGNFVGVFSFASFTIQEPFI